MKQAIKRLLFEAFRRNDMLDPRQKAQPLTKRWLGLGSRSVYRPVLDEGLMRWHDDKTPPPRCDGWLTLTDKGATLLFDHYLEFHEMLERLKQNTSYARSLASQYQLVRAV